MNLNKKNMRTEKDTVPVKAYMLKELAALYEVSPKTLRNWLQPHQKAIDKRVGRYYTILQVQIIFEKLGVPYNH